MHHVAANDRTTATVVVIGEDRKGGWIGTRPRIIEDGVALILRPAEIRALDLVGDPEIDFFPISLTDIGDGDSAVVERKAPGVAQAISIDLIAPRLAHIGIRNGDAVSLAAGGQRPDPEDLAAEVFEISCRLASGQEAAAVAHRHVKQPVARPKLQLSPIMIR